MLDLLLVVLAQPQAVAAAAVADVRQQQRIVQDGELVPAVRVQGADALDERQARFVVGGVLCQAPEYTAGAGRPASGKPPGKARTPADPSNGHAGPLPDSCPDGRALRDAARLWWYAGRRGNLTLLGGQDC
jgi:hypothetical protein